MSRKQPKRRAGNMVLSAIAGIFILAVACGVGFGAASADSSDDVARAGAFGYDRSTQQVTSATQAPVPDDAPAPDAYYEQSALAQASARNIDAGLKMIDDKEQAERERIAAEKRAERERVAAEKAAALERVRAQKEMQGVVVEYQPVAQDPADQEDVQLQEQAEEAQGAVEAPNDSEQAEEAPEPEEVVLEPVPVDYEYDLPAVDWSVSREEFVGEWTGRIDAYLAGSPLEGYGYAFAEAAWDNGVDPRWSPAISNTESSKGAVCFLPCNAWGWGSGSWGDWDTAIRAHVAGLAAGYGYCITPEAAASYCPPNAAHWYSATIEQMSII